MLNKVLEVTKRLVKKNRVNFFDDDVFLVSYPKSGNTWLRFLIGNYLSNNNCDFKNSHLLVPDIDFNPESIVSCPKPRFIKSHKLNPKHYKKVVYLVRDGRDVAVSYFFHLKKYNLIPKEMTFKEYIPLFINGSLSAYGSWGGHVCSWMSNSNDESMIIRYEDLKNNTPGILKKILIFSGSCVDDKKITQAVAASGIVKMQKIEKQQHKETILLSKSDPSVLFVRKGSVGDWVNYFDRAMHDIFLDAFGSVLNEQGYDINFDDIGC